MFVLSARRDCSCGRFWEALFEDGYVKAVYQHEEQIFFLPPMVLIQGQRLWIPRQTSRLTELLLGGLW